MPISANHFFYFYQSSVPFFMLTQIAPCPLQQAVTCHLLHSLLCKVQEKAFLYLFPINYNETLYTQTLRDHGASIANRGRTEYQNKLSDKYKILNNAFASAVIFLLAKSIGWIALNKFIIPHYLFSIRLLALQTAAKISVFILHKIHRSVNQFFQKISCLLNLRIWNSIPKPSQLAMEKAKKIAKLLEEFKKFSPDTFEALEKIPDIPIDWITQEIPFFPVKEKGCPKHFWDITSLEVFFKNNSPQCPNGCGVKLELENEVDTVLQDKIIQLLKEALCKEYFSLLPFNEGKLKK